MAEDASLQPSTDISNRESTGPETGSVAKNVFEGIEGF